MLRFLIAFMILIFSFPAFALDMKDFKTIPVLHEGRIKPLDTFARAELKTLHGSESLPDETADVWLAQTIFDPGNAIDKPVFKIESANLRHSLGLLEKKNFFYSFSELVPGLKKTSPAVTAILKTDTKNLDRDSKDLLKIHDKALAYTSLMRSLSLLLPLNIDLPVKYKTLKNKDLSYLDLKKLEQNLDGDVHTIVIRKGENPDQYSNEERRLVILAFQMRMMSTAASDNNFLKIIPPQWQSDEGAWHAPWELLQKGEGSPQSAALLAVWKQMGNAYNANDTEAWNEATRNALKASAPDKLLLKLKLETFQNKFPPLDISVAFYVLTLIATILFLVFCKSYLRHIALLCLSTGAIIHTTGIALRIFLLMRPPVGTLYESLMFVSLITVLISLLIEKITKNGTGLLLGSLTGLSVGLLSFGFSGEGDTMEMLTAVLNTNFWLATHVLCITMGYGWCILTAVFAHLYLASKSTRLKFQSDQSLYILHTLSIVALLFTAIGTILGGIWADQSWGRFWGWDPKENGALLIVLWLVWLLHGKLGKQMNENKFMAGLAYLNVVVSISWIGVNLLGVGLHSYGFTEGLFYGLTFFILAETSLIWLLLRRAERAHA